MDIPIVETHNHYKQLDELIQEYPLTLTKLIHGEVNYIYMGKWNGSHSVEDVIIKFIQYPGKNHMENREINIIRELTSTNFNINIPERECTHDMANTSKMQCCIPEIIYYNDSPVVIGQEYFNGGWFVQKYIPGHTLFNMKDKDYQYVRHVFLLVIHSLDKIHKAGFIHGDTHGGNFIYSPQEDKISMIDFEYTYSYIMKDIFPSHNGKYRLEDDTYKLITTFLAYISGNSYCFNKFGELFYDPERKISSSIINMANKITKETTLEEFKLMLYNTPYI